MLPNPIDRGRRADLKFFARRPDRRYRVRSAFRGELESLGAPPPPPGAVWLVGCRKDPGGELLVVLGTTPPGLVIDCDALTEVEAGIVFHALLVASRGRPREVVETVAEVSKAKDGSE
jgi:hypothetical protein